MCVKENGNFYVFVYKRYKALYKLNTHIHVFTYVLCKSMVLQNIGICHIGKIIKIYLYDK